MQITATNNTANVQFNILSKAHIVLKVLNEQDVTIRLLVNEVLDSGRHNIPFYLSTINKGKHIVRLIVDDGKTIDIENETIHI